jgi:NADPH2:quinone reductase
MKAIAISGFGDTEVLNLIEVDKPKLKPGHVLIKVKATSINPLDFKLRKGCFPDLVTGFPMILHGDVAGIVVEVGPEVTRFNVGDEIYGCAGGLLGMQGASAEFMLADANLIAHKPKKLSFTEASALPLVSLTAWEGLITKANLQRNQSILIHGGTGGVGHIAIQLAHHLGAKVFATASEEKKLMISQQLGAEAAINYKTQTVDAYVKEHSNGTGFDVVFDTVGGENINHSIQAAILFGQVISILPSGALNSAAAFEKSLSIHFILQPLPLITGIRRLHYGEILEKMANLVDEGIIKPLIDEHQFTMKEIAAAHTYLEKGLALGKVVVSGF